MPIKSQKQTWNGESKNSRLGRISAVDVFLMPGEDAEQRWCLRKPWVFIAVRTSGGFTGWGEAFTFPKRTTALLGMLKDMGAFILGRDVADRSGVAATLYQDFGEQHAGPDFYAALSAVDIALWDAAGKALDVPVSTLVGAASEVEQACYANVWSNRPKPISVLADKAGEFVQQGYGCVKLYPMYHDTDEVAAKDLVRAVRQAIGPASEIIVDFWRLRSPDEVLRMVRAFDDPRIWIEDPLRLDNFSNLAALNREIGFSVIAGETESGLGSFRRLLESNAVAALAPDVALCGGITEMRRIADLALSHDVFLMPHCYNGPIAALATLNGVTGYRNFRYMETFPDLFEDGEKIISNMPRPLAGRLQSPHGPGFGMQIDESYLNPYRVAYACSAN